MLGNLALSGEAACVLSRMGVGSLIKVNLRLEFARHFCPLWLLQPGETPHSVALKSRGSDVSFKGHIHSPGALKIQIPRPGLEFSRSESLFCVEDELFQMGFVHNTLQKPGL